MSFVVETGTGSANANSYLTEAGADSYHSDHGNPSSWSSATQSAKEEALRLATQYLDAVYDGAWRGDRANKDQALSWPRKDAYDNDDYLIDSSDIPKRLEHATAELALKHIAGTSLLADVDPDDAAIVSESASLPGPLSVRTTYAGTKLTHTKFALVEKILAPLINTGGRVIRG